MVYALNQRKGRRQWPVCQATGKRRYGERKDARLALEAARRQRSRADLDGVTASWIVVRSYRCADCCGWHLTSRPAPA